MKPYDQGVEHILPYKSFLVPLCNISLHDHHLPQSTREICFCHCRLHVIQRNMHFFCLGISCTMTYPYFLCISIICSFLSVRSIPLYEYATICLFIRDFGVISSLWLLQTKMLSVFVYQLLSKDKF